LYSIKFNVSFSLVNSAMYRTSHQFPTLDNTFKVLHRLNLLTKNKQIASNPFQENL